MLIHFLNNYIVEGKTGNKININGQFPGMQLADFVFLSNHGDPCEEEKTYKIEQIEYGGGENNFKAVIVAEFM